MWPYAIYYHNLISDFRNFKQFQVLYILILHMCLWTEAIIGDSNLYMCVSWALNLYVRWLQFKTDKIKIIYMFAYINVYKIDELLHTYSPVLQR